jgi:hypothetical protein
MYYKLGVYDSIWFYRLLNKFQKRNNFGPQFEGDKKNTLLISLNENEGAQDNVHGKYFLLVISKHFFHNNIILHMFIS